MQPDSKNEADEELETDYDCPWELNISLIDRNAPDASTPPLRKESGTWMITLLSTWIHPFAMSSGT